MNRVASPRRQASRPARNSRNCTLLRIRPARRKAGSLCYTSLVIASVETGFGQCFFEPLRVQLEPFIRRRCGTIRATDRGLEFSKNRSLWISAIAALVTAAALAGCGTTYYFDGRILPPSKLVNRVVIAIQNPNVVNKGQLEIVDAFYDTRSGFNGTPAGFAIQGYGGALPITIQNEPEEQFGAVYGAGDGSFWTIDYSKEQTGGSVGGLNGSSSSIFITRNRAWVFAASQISHVLTVAQPGSGGSIPLNLPGIYRISVNPGGSVAFAFVQNSNYVYYPRQISSSQTIAFAGGPGNWPKAAVDCEPQNAPTWCLFQMQSPDQVDATGNYYGAPLTFDRPVKAVFSSDGSTAYILSCGPECGGSKASVSLVPIAPAIFLQGQQSGLFPCNLPSVAPCPDSNAAPMVNIPTPGGASNALVDTTTLYVVGQQPHSSRGKRSSPAISPS